MAHTVYKLTSPSGKAYIGKTQNFEKRMYQHAKGVSVKCRAIYSAIRYYGWENFSVEILGEYETGIKSSEGERRFIQTLNTFSPNGYNLTLGGEGTDGLIKTTEHKQRISEALRGKKFTFEHRASLAKAAKGRANNLPKVRTEAHKAKISAALSGRKLTAAHRAALSGARRNRIEEKR